MTKPGRTMSRVTILTLVTSILWSAETHAATSPVRSVFDVEPRDTRSRSSLCSSPRRCRSIGR
jgi:hypothetical protein